MGLAEYILDFYFVFEFTMNKRVFECFGNFKIKIKIENIIFLNIFLLLKK